MDFLIIYDDLYTKYIYFSKYFGKIKKKSNMNDAKKVSHMIFYLCNCIRYQS